MTADLPDRAAGRDALRAALAEALREAAHVCQHNPCTTCLIVSDEEFDTTVFGSAVHAGVVTSIEGPVEAIADALAVEAERFAAEQVAAALNSAADEEDAKAVAVGIRLDRCIPPGNWLRARAAAVLAAPDNDRRQG